MNWDYLHYMIKERTGYSLAEYSKVKLGKSASYLSQAKHGRIRLSRENIDYMIKDLGLDVKALFPTEEEEYPGEMSAEEFAAAFTEPEPQAVNEPEARGVADLLEEINTKLDMVLEIETKVNALSDRLSKLESAPPSILDQVISVAKVLKEATT